jgi:polyhydroxyalkanoate synthase
MMHLALMALTPDKMKDILTGLHNYHHHPYQRADKLEPLPCVWQSGEVRLLHAKATPQDNQSGKAPIFIIPSFINGSEILDLTEERSLIRWLAAQGHECYLLDWGDLTQDQQGTSLSDLIMQRLIPAFTHVTQSHEPPPVIMGYCLGGNFAIALAALKDAEFSKLILLATPWDFHHVDNSLRPLLLNAENNVKIKADENGAITTDYLQSLFVQTDLSQSAKKYAYFGGLKQNTSEAEQFVATEDWVNGGQPIPAKLIQECIGIFYKDNVTMNNQWRINGANNSADHPIDPTKIPNPVLMFAPLNDSIVPHASSAAFTPFLKQAQRIDIDTGHIGMLVGRRAKQLCWLPILAFIETP